MAQLRSNLLRNSLHEYLELIDTRSKIVNNLLTNWTYLYLIYEFWSNCKNKANHDIFGSAFKIGHNINQFV